MYKTIETFNGFFSFDGCIDLVSPPGQHPNGVFSGVSKPVGVIVRITLGSRRIVMANVACVLFTAFYSSDSSD